LVQVISLPVRLRRIFYGLRTERPGALCETAAVGLGVFIGSLPLYGLHLLICWVVGSLLRLNRLKVYLAANISNPLFAPWLLFAEVQTGAWLRRGSFHSLTPQAINTSGIVTVGGDLCVGSVFVGGVLAAAAAGWTYNTRRKSADDGFVELVRAAADRYVGTSVTAWEFARGKLRHDPVYRATLTTDLLGSGGTLLDIGCGQGLALALLAEAGRAFDAGRWPAGWGAPPRFDRMVGVETRPRIARLAQAALAGAAEIIEGDARRFAYGGVRAILVFDVLHLLRPAEQDGLLAAMAERLEPGGVVLVREADASAGWRATAVRLGNRLKAIACGSWRQEFHLRTEAEWRECFTRHHFKTDVYPMGTGTPFANVLFRLTAPERAIRLGHPQSPSA
jgi:uncharacterized protein (DUF2062 family)